MLLKPAKQLAEHTLQQALSNTQYTLAYGWSRQVAAQAITYPTNQVRISTTALQAMNPNEVIDLALHEAAHVICGSWRNQDRIWLRTFKNLGGVDPTVPPLVSNLLGIYWTINEGSVTTYVEREAFNKAAKEAHAFGEYWVGPKRQPGEGKFRYSIVNSGAMKRSEIATALSPVLENLATEWVSRANFFDGGVQ